MSAPRPSLTPTDRNADSLTALLLDMVEVGETRDAHRAHRRDLGRRVLERILAHDREAQRLARLDAAHAAAFDPQPDPLSHRCGSDAHGHQGVA
jgi:hypothetical protein